MKKIVQWLFSWKGLLMGLGILIILLGSTRFFSPSMAVDQPELLFYETGGWRDVYASTDEGVLHAVKAGDSTSKSLLVFIHGSPGSWSDFTQFADSFQLHHHHQLLFVDRPGYGASTHPHTGDLHDQAKAIMGLVVKEMTTHSLEKLVIFGHSYGGPVAMRVAVEYPEVVDGLVLAAPTIAHPFQEPRWYNKAANFFAVRWLLGDWLQNSNREMIRLYHEELLPLDSMLSTYRGPIAYIQGDQDVLVPAQSAGYFRYHCPECRVHFILDEEMNHFIPWSHPQYLSQALDWVEEQETLNDTVVQEQIAE